MEFESPFENKWIICRTCLKSSSQEMLNIFESSDNLQMKIEECSGVKLDTAVDLPDSICQKCFTLLKAALKFRTICQRSQKELIEQFGHEALKMESNNLMEEFVSIENDTSNHCIENTVQQTVVEREEELVYSVEYQDAQTEMIDIDPSAGEVEEAPFEVLKEDNDVVYEEPEMEDLELVLNLNCSKDVSSFKIVPQFSAKTNKQRPTKQPRRKVNEFESNEQASFICPECGNSYNGKAKLSLHMKIHSKEKPHQCEICFKRFSQTPQLARHMNSHTGNRPFMCRFCSASFADPSTRIKHERIHTNERPYKCTVCEKTFTYSSVLKVHMMTHTGEKPHICSQCGKRFSQAHHKRNHERLHENANSKLSKIEQESESIL